MRIFVLLSLEGKIDTVDSLQHCIVYIHSCPPSFSNPPFYLVSTSFLPFPPHLVTTAMDIDNAFPGTDAAVSGDLSFPGKIYNVNEIMKEAVQDVLPYKAPGSQGTCLSSKFQ
jgi:hypothetical protein